MRQHGLSSVEKPKPFARKGKETYSEWILWHVYDMLEHIPFRELYAIGGSLHLI